MNLARILPLLLVASGCSSLVVRSEPRGADVILIASGQDKGKSIGKTPLRLKVSELERRAGDGPVVLQLRKQGYLPANYVVPNVAGAQMQLETTLQPVSEEGMSDVNKVVRLTLRAERLILEKDLDGALKTADDIKKISDGVAAAYAIEGSVRVLKGDWVKAREALQRAIDLDPSDTDAVATLRLVNEKLKGGPG